jgi:nicotinamidase-related amidase
MKQALVVVDVQNDYFEGGKLPLVGMDEAAANARTLLDAFRAANAPLFHVQHLSVRPGAGFFVPGTEGCEIHPGVAPAPGEPVVQKNFPNAFRQTGLNEGLSAAGVDAVVICGAMSHMCVDSTARAAFDLGYACTVIADACATRDLTFGDRQVAAADVHAAFMAALSAPFAAIEATAGFLARAVF